MAKMVEIRGFSGKPQDHKLNSEKIEKQDKTKSVYET
jgi:hypothetical protein